jgi:hypothetical protein
MLSYLPIYISSTLTYYQPYVFTNIFLKVFYLHPPKCFNSAILQLLLFSFISVAPWSWLPVIIIYSVHRPTRSTRTEIKFHKKTGVLVNLIDIWLILSKMDLTDDISVFRSFRAISAKNAEKWHFHCSCHNIDCLFMDSATSDLKFWQR